jgi:hypothetical protein
MLLVICITKDNSPSTCHYVMPEIVRRRTISAYFGCLISFVVFDLKTEFGNSV